MKEQIKEEMKASLQYMAMAAYFSQDSVNRPGFAKHFFEAASEEREHGIKLIEQLLMRGKLTSGVGDLFRYTVSQNNCFIYPHATYKYHIFFVLVFACYA